ncbi:hypothetical protein C8Q74DRAFT_952734 [Fomes fomentarius]|nr:hypothetical protein C8Q74DRAFT_952734 [Fomes fomentarius]
MNSCETRSVSGRPMVRLDTVRTHSNNQMEERSTTSERGNSSIVVLESRDKHTRRMEAGTVSRPCRRGQSIRRDRGTHVATVRRTRCRPTWNYDVAGIERCCRTQPVAQLRCISLRADFFHFIHSRELIRNRPSSLYPTSTMEARGCNPRSRQSRRLRLLRNLAGIRIHDEPRRSQSRFVVFQRLSSANKPPLVLHCGGTSYP